MHNNTDKHGIKILKFDISSYFHSKFIGIQFFDTFKYGAFFFFFLSFFYSIIKENLSVAIQFFLYI